MITSIQYLVKRNCCILGWYWERTQQKKSL